MDAVGAFVGLALPGGEPGPIVQEHERGKCLPVAASRDQSEAYVVLRCQPWQVVHRLALSLDSGARDGQAREHGADRERLEALGEQDGALVGDLRAVSGQQQHATAALCQGTYLAAVVGVLHHAVAPALKEVGDVFDEGGARSLGDVLYCNDRRRPLRPGLQCEPDAVIGQRVHGPVLVLRGHAWGEQLRVAFARGAQAQDVGGFHPEELQDVARLEVFHVQLKGRVVREHEVVLAALGVPVEGASEGEARIDEALSEASNACEPLDERGL